MWWARAAWSLIQPGTGLGVLGARFSCWAAHVTWLARRTWLLTTSLAGSPVRLEGLPFLRGLRVSRPLPRCPGPSLQGPPGSLGKLQAAVFHPPGPSFPAARKMGPRKTLHPWPQTRPAQPQLPGALSHCPHLGLHCAVQGTPRGCCTRVSRRQTPVSTRAWHIGSDTGPVQHTLMYLTQEPGLRILSYDSRLFAVRSYILGLPCPMPLAAQLTPLPAVNPSPSCSLPSSLLLSFL